MASSADCLQQSSQGSKCRAPRQPLRLAVGFVTTVPPLCLVAQGVYHSEECALIVAHRPTQQVNVTPPGGHQNWQSIGEVLQMFRGKAFATQLVIRTGDEP